MYQSYSFGRGPFLRKYQPQEALATAGVPLLMEVLADEYGPSLGAAPTTTSPNLVGFTLDTAATINTAQQSDGSDPSVYVTIDTDPMIVVHAPLSGGSTSGTALTAIANTTASTNGLLFTATVSANYDDGYAWGATGGNVGQPSLRKATAVNGGASATFIVAQQNDIAVGDEFYFCSFGPLSDAGVTLTDTYDEVDATSDGQANNNFRCVFLHVFDASEQDVVQRSWAELRPFQHFFAISVA